MVPSQAARAYLLPPVRALDLSALLSVAGPGAAGPGAAGPGATGPGMARPGAPRTGVPPHPPPPIAAAAAEIVNVTTGRELWGREQNVVRSIASLTKVMTALVVIKSGNLDRRIL